MPIRPLSVTGALLFTAASAAAQVDSTRPLARPVGVDSSIPKRPFVAMGQALAINLLVNRFDAWVLGEDWAIKAGLKSWSTNIRLGWEWDEDSFQTNMFGHPYHGGLYFNAGRSNGMSYWESAPVSFLGSWTWEYLGENKRPSLNDFFMTSFGGIALGEMFHRIGVTIRDNRTRGGKRVWREFAAMPFDPVGGLNRLMRGQWKAVGPNPPEHDPGAFVVRVHAGARFEKGFVTDSVGRLWAVVADLVYGDPFLRPYRAPFDAFNVRAILSGGSGFNVLRATGRLYGSDLNDRSRRTRHLFAINQRYDYVSNPAQSIGGQSVEFGIYSRWRLGRGNFGIRTSVFGDIVLLGAIDSPSSGLGERFYDFGPGAGGRLQLAFERSGLRFITLFLQGEFIHSVSGATADHGILFGGWEINVPIARGLGLAFHATNFNRVSHYTDPAANPRTDRRYYPEVRILAVWTKFGFSPAP